MPRPVKLFFKFNSGVSSNARARVLKLLRARGASNVRRLFPRTKVPTLAHRYVAEGATVAERGKLMRLLQERREIAYVHSGTRRRPIRHDG